MKTLTDDEQALLQGLIGYWQDHADRCDNIANRPMAERQKAWDLAGVELLRKLQGIATMAGDLADRYGWASSQGAEASRERDRARLCLVRVASAVGIQPAQGGLQRQHGLGVLGPAYGSDRWPLPGAPAAQAGAPP